MYIVVTQTVSRGIAVVFFPVEPPVITEHPIGQTDADPKGEPVNFSVKAQGTSLNYQWWSNETTLEEDDHYSGVATPHLTIANSGIKHSGHYYCVVSNEKGSVASNEAQLVIGGLCAWICFSL